MNKNRKKAEKAVKKEKKDGPINWDTESETSVEKNKVKKTEGGKKKKNSGDLSKKKST